MAKAKFITGVVASVNGWEYTMENGDKVQSSVNCELVEAGATINYMLINSIKTVRIRTRTNQWDQTVNDGRKFFKQF